MITKWLSLAKIRMLSTQECVNGTTQKMWHDSVLCNSYSRYLSYFENDGTDSKVIFSNGHNLMTLFYTNTERNEKVH